MASDKSQITNNKSGTLERTGRDILRKPLAVSDSLRLQIIWHSSERVKFFGKRNESLLFKGISEQFHS